MQTGKDIGWWHFKSLAKFIGSAAREVFGQILAKRETGGIVFRVIVTKWKRNLSPRTVKKVGSTPESVGESRAKL